MASQQAGKRTTRSLSRRRLIALVAMATGTSIAASCAALAFSPKPTPAASEPATTEPTPSPAAVPSTGVQSAEPGPVLPPSIAVPTPTLTAKQSDSSGKVTVGTNQAPLEQPAFTKALSSFAIRYPHVSIDQWNIRTSYLDTVASWAAAGKLPDVLFTQLRHAGALAFRRWILSLDDLVKRDAAEISPDDFHAPLTREAKLGDKWIALPYDDSVGVIVYDAGVLTNAGKPAPADGWTWSDLATLAKATTQTLREGGKARWGFRWLPDAWMLPALWRSFGAGFAKDAVSVKITTDAHIQAIQWLSDLMADGVAARPADISVDQLGVTAGRVTAEAAGSWSLARYAASTASIKYNLQVFPKSGTSPRASHSAGTGWALTRDSRSQSAAWELIKHLSSRDTQELTIALPLRNLPSRISAVPLWETGVKALGIPENYGAVSVAAAEALTAEPCTWWLEFADACDNALPAVWEGRAKPADALAEIEHKTNAAAARYG